MKSERVLFRFTVENLSLLLMVGTMYLFIDSKSDNIIFYGASALFMFIVFLRYFLEKGREGFVISANAYSTSYFMFVIYALMSMLWATSFQTAAAKLMVVSLFVSLALLVYVSSEEKLFNLMKCIYISGALLAIKVVREYSGSLFSIGGRLKIENTNANTIGLMLALSFIMGIVVYVNEKKIFYVVGLPIYGVLILLSGSKKALLFVGGIIGIVYLRRSKNSMKLLIRFIIILISVFLLYYFITNVDWIYKAIGYRIDNLIGELFRGEQGEDQHRYDMAVAAISLFKKSPLFGIGFDMFRITNTISAGAYSHCNYTELLCNFGVVGLLLYYSRYLFLFSMDLNLKEKNIVAQVGVLLVCSMLLIDIAAVSYFSAFYQLIFVVGYKCSTVRMDEERIKI